MSTYLVHDNKHQQWSAAEIQKALIENNNLLDEWEILIKKNEIQPPEYVPFEDVNRHHFLVRIIYMVNIKFLK